ncbi:MAG: hypothetical protein ACREFX_10615 [Opitutaceae bacterium]
MSPSESAARRLVAALEEYTDQQALALRVGNCGHAVELQRRAAPLVVRLCALAREPGLAPLLGPRMDRRMEARRGLQKHLSARREALHAARRRIAESRRRLQELAAYGGGAMRGNGSLNATV